MLLTVEKLNELSKEISEWAKTNFNNPPPEDPSLGVLEEVGEIAHCLLKRKQKIRGFQKGDYFKTMFGDALADTAIYLLNLCGIMNLPFAEGSLKAQGVEPFQTQKQAVHTLAMCATDLVDPEVQRISVIQSQAAILESLSSLALMYELDLDQLVIETWEKNVSKRDWVANPENADKVANPKAPGHKPGKKPAKKK